MFEGFLLMLGFFSIVMLMTAIHQLFTFGSRYRKAMAGIQMAKKIDGKWIPVKVLDEKGVWHPIQQS